MEREERLILKEELRVKLEVYDLIIRRLQFEKMNLWELQILNELELKKLAKEGEHNGQS